MNEPSASSGAGSSTPDGSAFKNICSFVQLHVVDNFAEYLIWYGHKSHM